MRLLHTRTRTIRTFTKKEIPKKYAILSHTWQENEVTYQDMKLTVAEKMMGYQKIAMACSVSAARGYRYVWLDTCCIDKDSSAELCEAINCMYGWYEGAQDCFAYLADVSCVGSISESRLRGSSWFKRGWTLQELIAPARVTFFSREWQPIGTKDTLKHEISCITGIPVSILSGDGIDTVSVAQVMSWASMRDTTRIEDVAYCLMGLFDVNMPLLYGEGDKAFIRLQEQIMKQSDDYSLFAWKSDRNSDQLFEQSEGLLASSPAAFANCGHVVRLGRFGGLPTIYTSFTISNKGIHLTLPVIQEDGNTCLAVLNCTENGRGDHCLGLQLEAQTMIGEYFTVQRQRLRLLKMDSLLKASVFVKKICVGLEPHMKNNPCTLQKRRREAIEAGNYGMEDDGNTRSKRVRCITTVDSLHPRFACPYYKHSPTEWKSGKSCRGPGWKSISRVRNHVLLQHGVWHRYECNRCCECFENMHTLHSHQRTEIPCEIKVAVIENKWIDKAQARSLLSQKAVGTNEQRWEKIFQIIFPGETVPSPYFGNNNAGIEDEEALSVDSSSVEGDESESDSTIDT